MASSPDSISMALFCDFENVALGVRDAKYEKFDIKRVLERLLLKGSIVVKKAYCDWDRYKSFKAAMHEANFELIEIPHVRQSGKNSADIRLVVDALDLCYTKSHVDTFVIISGDSDFSPLVSKLRENAKQVIGVGVKQSTSDLLIANCDEFIFYDDLVRDSQRAAAKREARDNPPASRRQPEEDKARREELESRRSKAIDIAVETFDALLAERGESGKIWSSMLKEAIKRRKPDFNESYFGFRAFGNLLEEAQARGLLELGRDEKSGIFVTRPGPGLAAPMAREEFVTVEERAAPRAGAGWEGVEADADAERVAAPAGASAETPASVSEPRRGRGRGRGRGARAVEEAGAEPAAPEAHGTAAVEAGGTAMESVPAALVGPAETVAPAAAAGAGYPEASVVPIEPAATEPEIVPGETRRSPATRRRRGGKADTPVAAATDVAAGAPTAALTAAPTAAAADLLPVSAAASAAPAAGVDAAQGEKPKGKGKGKDKPKQKEKPTDAAKLSSRRGRGGRGAGGKAAAEGADAAAAAADASPSAAPVVSAEASPASPAPVVAPAASAPETVKPAERPRRARKPKSESGE
ncbi:NYN domain-containing protein [Thauera phenylacetica]